MAESAPVADGFYWASHIATRQRTIIYVNNARYQAFGDREAWDGYSMEDLHERFVIVSKIEEPK